MACYFGTTDRILKKYLNTVKFRLFAKLNGTAIADNPQNYDKREKININMDLNSLYIQ